MKAKKYLVLAAMAIIVAALALVGCSSGGSASSASASSASASASSASASSEAASSEAASSEAASSSASASSAAAAGSKFVSEGKLVIATSPDYPPFENLENGEYVGLDIEIAKAIADIGISGFSVDPERAKEIDFSSSYYVDDQAIAVMKDSNITADNAEEALNQDGFIIAVQSGTTGEAYVQENYPNAKAQPYGNSTDAFAAMQSGQAQAVCTNKAVVDKMLADAYQDAVVVKSIATGEEYAIVVSKDNPELTASINEALATRTYCYNMIMFVYLFCVSITQGGDILVGHLVGQQRHQAAFVLGNYFFRWAMIITLTGSALLALTGRNLLSAFTDNQEIIAMGVWILVIDWFLEIGRTANIFAGSTLRATGDTVYPFVVGVIFQWSVAVGLSYVIGIPLGYGLVGMWIGFALDENIRGVILMRRWHSGKWRTKGFVHK